VFADLELATVLDELLRSYEDSFMLRKPFVLHSFMKGKAETDVRFVGGAVESQAWSYLNETKATVRVHSKLPPNVQVQIPLGQPMPLITGLPREIEVEVTAQGWSHNLEPQGVTT